MSDQISRILKVAEVCARTGLCRVTIHNLRHKNDFPEPIKLSAGRVGWFEHEVNDWLARRASERSAA
ncbi:AlpA family phage regulatory protein [Sphingobium sp. AS12]|uniref:helix-turn-helix transcriptional regulator n=1 Tax=Sphingobium sp. AS12 TaxID=2849495 RepID=UPI001C31591D|nr:AlpA family phage regulatory protein [Sphingobium sp. AS12]MBV2146753.1 AlpA family phage regulatory protein [Sphingobium sp. AS12]